MIPRFLCINNFQVNSSIPPDGVPILAVHKDDRDQSGVRNPVIYTKFSILYLMQSVGNSVRVPSSAKVQTKVTLLVSLRRCVVIGPKAEPKFMEQLRSKLSTYLKWKNKERNTHSLHMSVLLFNLLKLFIRILQTLLKDFEKTFSASVLRWLVAHFREKVDKWWAKPQTYI